jgi:cell wall-associated NlpC family hydrolase
MKTSAPITTTYHDDPRRVHALDGGGQWQATFTVGAYTVTLRGPSRSLREGRVAVRHDVWVRSYPEPFQEANLDPDWLARALRANAEAAPDVLAIAFQYTAGIRRVFEGGLQIAGNARYGPRTDGSREEGADFNDYLGIAWEYPDEPLDVPESRQIRCLDCSGFVRMVYGYRRSLDSATYRSSVPLCRAPRADRRAIPRRAHEIFTAGPGITVIADEGRQTRAFDALATGDLVFFDADAEDGPRLDHVGIYAGVDTQGHHRFISSRKRANGPTIADLGGRSILDGDGIYARAFRAARRL